MSHVDLSGLKPVVAERLKPFMDRLVCDWGANLTHCFVVGSATTPDFDERVSDINTLAVLEHVHIDELSSLAQAGPTFGRKGISAPLLLTRRQIERSLDVFPVVFLNFKLHHQCILGDDILAQLTIGKPELRVQCERELRSTLIRLGQDYLRARTDPRLLVVLLRSVYSATLPLLTAILFMKDAEIPPDRASLTSAACRAVDIEPEPFDLLEKLRRGLVKPPAEQLTAACAKTYSLLEKLTDAVDALDL